MECFYAFCQINRINLIIYYKGWNRVLIYKEKRWWCRLCCCCWWWSRRHVRPSRNVETWESLGSLTFIHWCMKLCTCFRYFDFCDSSIRAQKARVELEGLFDFYCFQMTFLEAFEMTWKVRIAHLSDKKARIYAPSCNDSICWLSQMTALCVLITYIPAISLGKRLVQSLVKWTLKNLVQSWWNLINHYCACMWFNCFMRRTCAFLTHKEVLFMRWKLKRLTSIL
jgi:hypothetical protein